MVNEKITIEKLIGENAVERTKTVMMKEVLLDEETHSLFNDVCDELNESEITDIELVEMINLLSHDLKSLISISLKNRNIGQLFRLKEYEEFILDCKSYDKNKENNFEKRFVNIKTVDYKKFLKKRILTREEIESLIGLVVKKSGLESLSYKEKHETYSGDNEYLKSLVKAHKILSGSKHTQVRSEIKLNVNKILLKNVLINLKEYNCNAKIGK